MKAGEIVLFKFPQTDLKREKLRPALVIARLPGNYDDWLICMISTKKHQFQSKYDVLIPENSEEFKLSGLKSESIIRSTRLAVVHKDILLGSIVNISDKSKHK
jgi:mRNA interferase MazF